jgi:hypothetical protein
VRRSSHPRGRETGASIRRRRVPRRDGDEREQEEPDAFRPDRVARVRSYVRDLEGLFARHGLLTFAGAIAFEMFVASIALSLLGLGVLGAIGRRDVWDEQLAPQLQKRFLPEVYRGIDQTAPRIFAHDSTGLMASRRRSRYGRSRALCARA